MNPKAYLDTKKIPYIPSSGGRELRTLCPFCKNPKQKCHINSSSGSWYCFHCDKGGSFKMILEKLNLPYDSSLTFTEDNPDKWDMVTPIEEEIVEENHQRLMSMLKSDPAISNYLHIKRGYADDTIKRFKLGWGMGANLLIPIYSGKNCINFKIKKDPTRPNPSKGMLNIEGRGKKRLFNEEVLLAKTKKDTERIIICEGEWDCMLLTQYGYSAVTSTGGAMGFSEDWIPAFNKFNKVYVCLDNDRNSAGEKGAKKIADMFLKHGIRVFMIKLPAPTVLEEKVDITDFFVKRKKTKDDFTELLKSAREYSSQDLAFEKYRFMDGATLLSMEFPENKWLVDRFIQQGGVTCIAGPGGAGKSFFTTYLASCMVQGKPVMDKFKTIKGNVLFIDKENGIEWTQARLKKFNVPKEAAGGMFFMSQGEFTVENKEAVDQVLNAISVHDIKLVIIDTLIKIHSGNEISPSDINLVSQVFWKIQQAGAAVLFVHHFVKATAQFPITNVISALRGSSHIYNMVDNYFAFYIKDNTLRLEMAKARNDELMKPFKIDFSLFDNEADFQYVGEITEEEEESHQRVSCGEIIKRTLTSGKKTRQEIINSAQVRFSLATIKRTLSDLKKLGEIDSQANGREVLYFIPLKIKEKIHDEQLEQF